MGSDGSSYIWYRPEFMEWPGELATFSECSNAVGKDITKSIAKWMQRYPDFPKVVCAADDRDNARKYLVKSEFAEWMLAHQTEMLEREQILHERLVQDAERVSKRIKAKENDIRIAKGLQEKWPKRQ